MNEIICRECHSPNKPGSKFCSSCGASLKSATHIICPTCYHRNALHLLYCDSCGTRLIKHPTRPIAPAPEEPTAEAPTPPRAFSLPARNPGETGELDPDSLPDWLKTGVEKKSGIPPAEEERLSDWLNELKSAGTVRQTDELGDLNLDWLQEPAAVADPSPISEPEPEPLEASAEEEPLDWLSAFGDDDVEEEPADDTHTGFTGWLTPDTAEQEPAPTPRMAEEQNWPDDDADQEMFISEDSGRTGFTGWLESKRLNPSDVGLDDEDDEDDLSPLPPSAASGFTGWLQEHELIEQPVDLGKFSPSAGETEGNSGFTGWLTNQGLAADDEDTDDTAPTRASSENDLDDWLTTEGLAVDPDDELDEETTRQDMVGTGFTGWLNPATLDEIENREQEDEPSAGGWGHTASNELPDWLDTGELPSLDEGEEEEEVGTGFTGWLNPQVLEATTPSPPMPTAEEPEAPSWLLAGDDDDDEEGGGGTGFTDWLSAEKSETDDDDDDMGWLDEEEDEAIPQELMTPLSKEEAHQILENTPDVSDEFIQEVVEGDFPDWLTDVKNNEDAVNTEVLPDWISAPLSTTDELELGLHPSRMAAAGSKPLPAPAPDDDDDDDWLSGLGTPSLATGDADDSWLTGLGGLGSTAAPAADEPDDDWLGDLGLGGEEFIEPESITPPSTAAEDAAWLADMPSDEYAPSTADDDWLADIQLQTAATGGDTDFLSELPERDDQPTEEWGLGGLDTGSLSGLDWLSQAEEDPSEEDELFAEPLASPEPEPEPIPSDEFSFLSADDDAYTYAADETSEEDDGFDWLGALEDVDMEPTGAVMADRQAWLQGADLDDDEEQAGSREVDREVEEALQAATLFTRQPAPKDEPEAADIDQLVRNLGEDDDALADEAILSELEALRQTDGLDEEILTEYETHLQESNADITSGDLLGELNLIDPSLQHKQVGGPLSGLVGIVPMVTAVSELQPAQLMAAQPALDEQTALLRHITRQDASAPTTDLLDELLGAPADARATQRFDWAQLVLGILLILAVIGGLFLPNLVPTAPPSSAPGLIRLENQLALLRGQTVLVAFDYTPATAGELSPSATLLLAQLVQNNNQLVTMSQLPTGLATAAPLLERLPVVGSLGYVPGESLGLRQLAGCLNEQPCGWDVPPLAAVLVLAGDRDSLQDWVEQVAPQIEQPILAAVPQAVVPAAQPYLTSGQLEGLMAGLPAAALHEQTLGRETAVQTLLQSQSLAHVLVLAVLLSGAVAALLGRKRD